MTTTPKEYNSPERIETRLRHHVSLTPGDKTRTINAAADALRDLRVALVSQIEITNMERAKAEAAEKRLSNEQQRIDRLRGLLDEARMHLTNAPMSLRAYADPKTLAARIEKLLK